MALTHLHRLLLLGALLISTFTAVTLHSTPVEAQEQRVPCVEPIEVPAPQAQPAPATAVPAQAHATGAGIRVAVIDTGVNNHAALGGVIPGGDVFSPTNPDPFFDCDGHGTAVAGAVRAVAPDATIISVRHTSTHFARPGFAFDDPAAELSGTLASLADAIDIALDHKARVINISIVACIERALAQAVDLSELNAALERAEATGTVIVAAAGNSGSHCPEKAAVFPAHLPTVIAVAARDGRDLAEYSLEIPEDVSFVSYNGHFEIAPASSGENFAIGFRTADGTEQPFMGTSFASPGVAGMAALIAQRYPHYSAQEIRDAIFRAAQPAGNALDPWAVITASTDHPAPVAKHLEITPAAASTATNAKLQTLWMVLAGVVLVSFVLAGLIRGATSPTDRRRNDRPSRRRRSTKTPKRSRRRSRQ